MGTLIPQDCGLEKIQMKSNRRSAWQGLGRASQRLALLMLLAISVMQSRTVWAGINVWTSIGPKGGSIQALAIDPQNPSTIYAGTHTNGVVKSTDGGTNW